MALDCQKATKIGVKEFLDNPLIENIKSNRVSLFSTKKIESLGTEDIKQVKKSDVEIGIDNVRSFTDLPVALVSEILNFLDPKGLGIVSCVDTYLYKLASEHHVWKEFYHERWGHPISSVTSGDVEKSWKEMFMEREFRSRTFMGRYSIHTMYGHKEAVRTVFVLVCKKLVFTSGYDQIVRMWGLEDGLSVASSRPLGCTIRAVAADSRVLIAGGTDGFIHGWKVEEGNPHLFDLNAVQNQNSEFRVWEHEGPITCLALDCSRMYSGSWDMTIRVWDRSSLSCLNVLVHNDWVWSLAPHESTVGSVVGSGVYIWDVESGKKLASVDGAHCGNANSLARSHTGKLLFTGGDDGSVHMFEMTKKAKCNVRKIATWIPHSGPVYSLAFEFPWLVSASSDGKIALIDVRKLLKTNMRNNSKGNFLDQKNVEPPQRMLHGFGCNLFSVGVGSDRIVCGGEEGVVRIWDFSQALEIEQRVQTSRGVRLENRMRRQKRQMEISSKGKQIGQSSAAGKNQMNTDKNGWHNRRKV